MRSTIFGTSMKIILFFQAPQLEPPKRRVFRSQTLKSDIPFPIPALYSHRYEYCGAYIASKDGGVQQNRDSHVVFSCGILPRVK